MFTYKIHEYIQRLEDTRKISINDRLELLKGLDQFEQEIRDKVIEEFSSMIKNKAMDDLNFTYDLNDFSDCEDFVQEIDNISKTLKENKINKTNSITM